MLNEKKGLSSVVVTISLVLLSIVAVAVIAGFIIPLVRDNLDEGTECFDYRAYFSFEEEFGFNCYREEFGTKLYGVSVRAQTAGSEVEEKVKGFKLVFLKEGESVPVSVVDDSGEIRMLNTSKPVEIPKSGEVRTYVYESTETFDAVEIFPFLESGRVCDRSDSTNVRSVCESSLDIE